MKTLNNKKKIAKKQLKKTSTKKVSKKKALPLVSLKMSSKMRKDLKARAAKFARGNLSFWLRYTGLKYVPTKNEQIAILKQL